VKVDQAKKAPVNMKAPTNFISKLAGKGKVVKDQTQEKSQESLEGAE